MRKFKFVTTQGKMAKRVILNYLHGYTQENLLLGIKGTEGSIESAVKLTGNMVEMPKSIW